MYILMFIYEIFHTNSCAWKYALQFKLLEFETTFLHKENVHIGANCILWMYILPVTVTIIYHH